MTQAHEPTEASRKQVEALSAYGVPQADICKVVGISKPTLQRHYRQELDTGAAMANSQVAQRLFKIATEGSGRAQVAACIFWLKARAAGWSEKHIVEHSGSDEGPIQVSAGFERFVRLLDGVAQLRASGIDCEEWHHG